jgi:hypothetical protein
MSIKIRKSKDRQQIHQYSPLLDCFFRLIKESHFYTPKLDNLILINFVSYKLVVSGFSSKHL